MAQLQYMSARAIEKNDSAEEVMHIVFLHYFEHVQAFVITRSLADGAERGRRRIGHGFQRLFRFLKQIDEALAENTLHPMTCA